MGDPVAVGVAVAFTAGVLSFLSPCVLPLVPGYVTFITGVGAEGAIARRHAALVHGVLFVLGFTLVFLALGAGATAFGAVLRTHRLWLSRVGGVLVIVLGLSLLGVIRIDALQRERRVHLAEKPLGFLGTVLVGVAFGAGWTPCIGPVLGAILTYTASTAELTRGLTLLGAYAAGLAVPFLLAAVALDRFLGFFAAFKRHLGVVNRVSGALLVAVGVLMATDTLAWLATALQAFTPEAIRGRI